MGSLLVLAALLFTGVMFMRIKKMEQQLATLRGAAQDVVELFNGSILGAVVIDKLEAALKEQDDE